MKIIKAISYEIRKQNQTSRDQVFLVASRGLSKVAL